MGPYSQIKPTLADNINIEEHPDAIYPQVFLIFISTSATHYDRSMENTTLGWLNTIIPQEEVYKDLGPRPSQCAERLLGELLRNGTTTAAVYGSWAKSRWMPSSKKPLS